MSTLNDELEFIALAANNHKPLVRHVSSAEGAIFFGLPEGSIIPPHVEKEKVDAAAKLGLTPPKGALSAPTAAPVTALPQTKEAKAAAKAMDAAAPAPAPEAPAPAKVKVSKSSISGNQHFSVGDAKYSAPDGSKLILPNDGSEMAFVLTPDAQIHAFSPAGEMSVPPELGKTLATKFSGDLTGNPHYTDTPFEGTSSSYSISNLSTGAILTDSRGTPHFRKLEDGNWQHVDLGSIVTEKDLQPLYDNGELIPQATPKDQALQAAFKDTTATNFGEMSKEELVSALDSMETGAQVHADSGVNKVGMTKQEDGTWKSDQTGQTAASADLFMVAFALKPGPVPASENKNSDTAAPAKATTTDPAAPASVPLNTVADPGATPTDTAAPVVPKVEAPAVPPKVKVAPADVLPAGIPEGSKKVTNVMTLPIGATVMQADKHNIAPPVLMEKTGLNTWKDHDPSMGYTWGNYALQQDAQEGHVYLLPDQATAAEPVAPKAPEVLKVGDKPTEAWLASAAAGSSITYDAGMGVKGGTWDKTPEGKWVNSESSNAMDPSDLAGLVDTYSAALHHRISAIGKPAKVDHKNPDNTKVGDTITSVAGMDSLPMGTKLAFAKKDGSESYYTKLDNGKWLTPGNTQLASSELTNSANSGKFSVSTLPAPKVAKVYAAGDPISDATEIDSFTNGTVVKDSGESVYLYGGTWTKNGKKVSSDEMYQKALSGNLTFESSLTTPAPSTTAGSTSFEDGGPSFSKTDIAEALKALEDHPSFQIAYGLKSVPNNPLAKLEKDRIKIWAASAYPDLKPKAGAIQLFKDKLGIQDSKPTPDTNAVKISLGSKDPKATPTGVTGGEFTHAEMQQAVDILEAFNGKVFKSELNKQGNPLGTLNVNDLVGFSKDKQETKQKFIDLLKTKLAKNPQAAASVDTPTAPEVNAPEVLTPDTVDALLIGSVINGGQDKENFTKFSKNLWLGEGVNGATLGHLTVKAAVGNSEWTLVSKGTGSMDTSIPSPTNNPDAPLNASDLAAMSTGSKLLSDDLFYTKKPNGMWSRDGDPGYEATDYTMAQKHPSLAPAEVVPAKPGDVLTQAQFETIPVGGSVLFHSSKGGGDHIYTQIDTNWWESDSNGSMQGADMWASVNMGKVTLLDKSVTKPDSLTHKELSAAAPGTKVSYADQIWTKGLYESWTSPDSSFLYADEMAQESIDSGKDITMVSTPTLSVADVKGYLNGTKVTVEGDTFFKASVNTWWKNNNPDNAFSDMHLASMNPALVEGTEKKNSIPSPTPAIPEAAPTPGNDTSFTGDNVVDAPVGTVLKHSAGSWITKTSENQWTAHNGEQENGTFTDTWVKSFVDNGAITKPAMDPANTSPTKAGKYVGKGKVYMVTNADGTGMYVNMKGDATPLTAEKVTANLAAGMNIYAGEVTAPEASVKTPVVKKAAVKLVGDVKDLPDGTYFVGDPKSQKSIKYTISGDQVTVAKSKTSTEGATSKLGGSPSSDWVNNSATGAQVYHKTYGNTYTKSADGKWLDATSTEMSSTYLSHLTGYWQSDFTVVSHGPADSTVIPKEKLKTQFLTGKILNEKGHSILPKGYTGTMSLYGGETTVPALLGLQTVLNDPNNTDTLSAKLQKAGVWFNNTTFKAEVVAEHGEYSVEKATATLKSYLDSALADVDKTIPKNDSPSIFTFTELGEAQMPSTIAALDAPLSYSASSLNTYIKMVSSKFGDGKVIGLFAQKMTTNQKNQWVESFAKGDFGKMYQIEVVAASVAGKAHTSGFLHPGFSGNPETNQITWGPAVPGEVSALTDVHGDWSSISVDASLPEVDNYLIKAQMQYPTFLTAGERRVWVKYHRKGLKVEVDKLSAQAKNRSDQGNAPHTSAPVWSDDVKPAKSYDSLFDDTEFPVSPWSQYSGATKAADYYDDHTDNAELKKIYDEKYASMGAGYENGAKKYAVLQYFTEKKAAYEAELLKPVYTKVKQITGSTNEVWLVKDQFDSQYIFKPWKLGREQRSKIEHASNVLGGLWGYSTPGSRLGVVEGDGGVIQDFAPSVSSFVGPNGEKIDLTTLDAKQLGAVASEHVLDWIMDNDDTHKSNILIKADGKLVGIDKGRAFYQYGHWNGLSGNSSANTQAAVVYTDMYDAIRAGKLPKEHVDAAYFAAMKSAKRIQNADPVVAEALLREGLAGRKNWDAGMSHYAGGKLPANEDQLIAAFLDRKSKLMDDVSAMWTKIYKDSGYEGLPEAPPNTLGEDHLAGWDDAKVTDKVVSTKVWGSAPIHSSAAIQDGHSLLWTEKNDKGDDLFKGELIVGGLTQQKMLSYLHPKVTASSGAPANNLVGFPDTADWKSAINGGAKTISQHPEDKAYDTTKMTNFDTALGQVAGDLAFWSADLKPINGASRILFPSGKMVPQSALLQYRLGLEHYQIQINKALEAKANGTKTLSAEFTLYSPIASPPDSKIYTHTDGTIFTSLTNGKAIKQSAGMIHLVDQTEIPAAALTGSDGWTNLGMNPKVVAAGSTIERKPAGDYSGQLKDNGVKIQKDTFSSAGHDGTMYEITLTTGETIRFRNSSSTSTDRSQQGMVTFTTVGGEANHAVSLARIQDELALMGLDTSGADGESAELVYWRQMFQRMVLSATGSSSQQVKTARAQILDSKHQTATKLGLSASNIDNRQLVEGIGLSRTAEEELAYWREMAASVWGQAKVDDFIESGSHLPQYDHNDLTDVTKGTGKPYWNRIDVTKKEILDKGTMIAIGNKSGDAGLLNYIKSGGMISTEARLRILGHYKQGQSSGADQMKGGANGVFTRVATGSALKSGELFGQHVAYWNPDVSQRISTYAYSGDKYGDWSYLESHNSYNPLKSLDHTASDNELLVNHGLSVYDNLEIMIFEDIQQRDNAIQIMKKAGITHLRGLPIEERLIMKSQQTSTMAKVVAQWSK